MSVTDDNSIHAGSLNFSHQPSRKGNSDKLHQLRNEANELKKGIVSNLTTTVKDQFQDSIIFEFASAFDLSKPLGFTDQLFDIYCNDYVYNVAEDADFWSDYTITIQYSKKINCTKAEMKT